MIQIVSIVISLSLITACGEGVDLTKSQKFSSRGSTTGGATGGTTGGSTGGLTGGSSSGRTTGGTLINPDVPTETGSACDGSPGFSNSTRIGSPPPEGIDLNNVIIVGSADVRGFAKTASVSSVGFRPGTFQITYSHLNQWAPYAVDIGGGTMQAATAWVFFYIEGQWYGAGMERMRPYQTEKNQSLYWASDLGCELFYNSSWGLMSDYRPAPGEMVGFMVTSGSTRLDSTYEIAERSNIVMIEFPSDYQDAYYSNIVWSE